ncbi:MAG: permease [Acidobacteria bacterium]|nr:MAG: permease [Acidobacteriota bacterium]
MDNLFKDLGYAARVLRKNAGFTAIAIATIALGIGACTAIFSVVNAVLLRPLPYVDAQRLVLVWGELRARNVPDWPFSPPDYRDMRQHTTAFADLAGITPAGRVPIGGDSAEPEQIRVAGATPNVFRLLGARIAIGRDFTEDDAMPQPQPPAGAAQPPGQPPPPRLPAIAIISHELWQRRYGGDAAIVGRTVDFGGGGGRAHIVGVLAPGFEILFPPRVNVFRVPDMWTAVRINYETANRNNVIWRVIGRLKPGVTIEQADAQVEAVATDIRQHFQISQTAGLHFHVVPMHDDLVKDVRRTILTLMGAVLFVLLIACANVANLLVVRASARGRELAIRAAIGGSRWRLVRQMLAESLLLAGAGTALGLALARGGIQALIALAPPTLPRLESVAIDPIVLAFTVTAGFVTAIACGVVPALRASRPDLMDVLRQSGGSPGLKAGRALRNSVIVGEVAASFVLLIGSGLMLRSFVALQHVNPGFDPNGVLTFLMPARGQQPAERAQFMRRVRERLRALPGVRGASATGPLPLDGQLANARWGPEAAKADPSLYRQADVKFILPDYFETLRTRLIQGRTFSEADNAAKDAKLIIIDDHLAARAFPNQSAVGKRLLARIITADAEPFEVIGVVAHQRHASLAIEGPEAMFFADGYVGPGAANRWIVRTAGDPTALTPAVRAAIGEIDPKATLAEVQPMTEFVDRAMAPTRFAMLLFGIFAGVAVVLAGVGLYGVLSTVVRQRTAEIGMRMVFGAPRARIFTLVIGEGLRLSAAGVAIGLLAAFGITRLMATLLVGVKPTDPITFVAITLLFFVIAALACWLPAQRAAGLDPAVALRDE